MFLPLDTSSGLPIYRQIMEQVRRMVAARALTTGDKLPSVRDISGTLGVNPLTVAKAYQELERSGVVEMRRGLGVFISAPTEAGGGVDREARRRAVEGAAERLVLEAVQAGLGERELAKVVAGTWQRVRSGGRGDNEK